MIHFAPKNSVIPAEAGIVMNVNNPNDSDLRQNDKEYSLRWIPVSTGMTKAWIRAFVEMLLLFLCLSSCRGNKSELPPVHLNPNMDTQEKYKPYRESDWFADKMAMRPSIPNTIARGELREDEHFYKGKINGKLAETFPPNLKITRSFVQEGQRYFNIYCSPCHDQRGFGEGVVGRRMLIKPSSVHSDYLYKISHGHLFDVIHNGVRTMPDYKDKLSAEQIWKIVAWVRVLQISQNSQLKF